MKKRLFTTATIIIVAVSVIAISCNNNNKHTNSEPTKENIELLKVNLANYNANYLMTANVNTTKASPFWRKTWNVVAADALGFISGFGAIERLGWWGPILSGVASSIKEYCKNDNTATVTKTIDGGTCPTSNFTIKDGVIGNSSELTLADSVGFIHNDIVCKILNNFNGDVSNLSDNQLFSAICSEIQNKTNISTSLLEQQSMILRQNVASISVALEGDTEEDVKINLQKSLSHYSDVVSTMDIYYDAALQLPIDDVQDYTNGFNDIVNDSDLPTIEKKQIVTTATVAGSSKILWDGSL